MMRSIALCLFFAVLLTGCGGGVKEEVTVLDAISPADVLKATIGSVAQSGEDIGSGAEDIQKTIEELKKTDSAKGDELAEAFKDLASARDANARKNAAKKMLQKL